MNKWKKKLLGFLPMWAKETVLRDNRALAAENRALKQRLAVQEAYIKGLQTGLRRSHSGRNGGNA